MSVSVEDTGARLHALVAQFGPERISEGLGVEKEFLFAVMSGQTVMEADLGERFELLCRSLSDAVDWRAGVLGAMAAATPRSGAGSWEGEDAGSDRTGVGEEVVGEGGFAYGAGGEAVEGAEVAPGLAHQPTVGIVEEFLELVEEGSVQLPAPGMTWTESQAQRMENLWAARELALMTQFSLRMDETELLYAMGLVNQIELALIMMFGQSVPDRNRHWDEFRRQKEIYIRMVRRNRIQRDLRREMGGFKGLLRSLRGQKTVSAKDLYARLFLYVDDMVSLADQGMPQGSVMDGVRNFMDGGSVGRRRR